MVLGKTCTGCFAGQDLLQRMIRTFGSGHPVKKVPFLGVMFKNNASGKNGRFRTFWGSMVDHVVPKNGVIF